MGDADSRIIFFRKHVSEEDLEIKIEKAIRKTTARKDKAIVI
jgi:hypothetical protein